MKIDRMSTAGASARISPETRRELLGVSQALLFQGAGEESVRVVMVAGIEGGEGASTLASGLAHVLSAEALAPVCLVQLVDEAPAHDVHSAMPEDEEMPAAAGRHAPGADTEVTVAQLSRYDLLAAIDQGLRPSLRRLSPYAAFFILDAPPLLTSTAASIACRQVDGIVLVVESERTTPSAAEAARLAIERRGGRLIGAVLNKRRRHLPKFLARALGGL